MAITNEELSAQLENLAVFIDGEGDRVIEQLTIVHDHHPVKLSRMGNEESLKALAVVVVANVAAIGLWKGGEYLYQKYQEKQKKNNGGS